MSDDEMHLPAPSKDAVITVQSIHTKGLLRVEGHDLRFLESATFVVEDNRKTGDEQPNLRWVRI